MEAYRTIVETAEARLEEKKSEFIATVSYVDSEAAALAFLESVRMRHRTAGHNVYAYILRDGARARYSDDGEPAKTAGLPTLEVIRHAGLTDCIVVTTRYFGGTLLGTGGLVRAYTEAAKLGLAAAQQVEMRVCIRGVLCIDYAMYEQAAHVLVQAGARVLTKDLKFAQDVSLPFVLLLDAKETLLQQLQALCRGRANLQFSQPYYAPL